MSLFGNSSDSVAYDPYQDAGSQWIGWLLYLILLVPTLVFNFTTIYFILSSPALRANSRAMAIQAIYTNLLGLFLLLVLAPISLLVAIAVALFSGPGPVIESAECAGFQNIPFQLLRFRTLRKGKDPGTQCEDRKRQHACQSSNRAPNDLA